MIVINTYLEASFASQTSNSIDSIGKFVGSNDMIRDMVRTLLKKGWRISKENTDISGYETGIISPTPELGLFRLGGIIYYPADGEAASDILKRQFEKSDYFVQSLQRQFDVARKTKTKKFGDYAAQILEITLKIRDEWKPVLQDLPEAMLSSKGLTGPALVGMNLDNKGAFLVWGLNPENVSQIVDTLLAESK